MPCGKWKKRGPLKRQDGRCCNGSVLSCVTPSRQAEPTTIPLKTLKGALRLPEEHRPAPTSAELPEFYRRLAAELLNPATRLALHLLMLTMTRPGRCALLAGMSSTWNGPEWRIPAERMKMRSEHLVPFLVRRWPCFDELRQVTAIVSCCFPSERKLTNPMSENNT